MHESQHVNPNKIFITGFIGSDRLSLGKKLSKDFDYPLLVLDDMIVARDGRTLKKLIMMMGEHEYRNKEYEILKEYESKEHFVMVCGDGVVHDEMNLDILKRNPTVFLEEPLEVLWSRAEKSDSSLYAFLYDSDRENAFKKFLDFYQIRLPLYRQCSTYALEDDIT